MQPAARVAAAIEVLDAIFSGSAPEPALKSWARGHRFAGSKDRAAIRDHVFDALRRRASYGWVGGAETGRGVMLGAMRTKRLVDEVFTGIGHAPDPIRANEQERDLAQAPRAVRHDIPDWILPHFDEACGDKSDAVLSELQNRAAVFLRVNAARITRDLAQVELARDDIHTQPVEGVNFALKVIEGERKILRSSAYETGLVELQDASSQQAIEMLTLTPGARVLDYCAGGGGKALAMAARGAVVTATDIDPRRMADIPARAARAGVQIDRIDQDALHELAKFDLVLCDAPCSGSGTWRRDPAGKWALTPEKLSHLHDTQLEILETAQSFLRDGGRLAYATCSVFKSENSDVIQEFAKRNSCFSLAFEHQFTPDHQGDGFYIAQLCHR